MWVTLNMVSEMERNTVTSGSRWVEGSDARPRPNSTEKKIIGSISPFAIDATILVGTSDNMVPIRPWAWLCTSAVVLWYFEISTVASWDISMPAPGWNTFASVMPRMIATVVITSK